MKPLKAIACSLLSIGLSTSALAQIEPDYVCYMINSSGSLVNLGSMCVSATSSSPDEPQLSIAIQDYVRAGTAGFEGEVTNRSGAELSGNEVAYRITYTNGQDLITIATGTAFLVSEDGWQDGETITFGSGFTPEESERFDGYITNALKIELSWDGGSTEAQMGRESALDIRYDDYGNPTPGNCQYPWQYDSIGRRCGGRAASEQLGGL